MSTEAPGAIERPNHFTLRGEDVRVSLDTTTLRGVPALTYRDGDLEVSRSGDDIEVDDLPFGTGYTVTLEQIPDDETTRFTLVVPPINLVGSPHGRRVTTFGVVATHLTTIAGPPAGQSTVLRTVRLRGRATQVESLTV